MTHVFKSSRIKMLTLEEARSLGIPDRTLVLSGRPAKNSQRPPKSSHELPSAEAASDEQKKKSL